MGPLSAYSFGRRSLYHRALLDRSSQEIYDRMLSALKRGETSISLDLNNGSPDIHHVKRILIGVLNDSPLLFWVDGSIGMTTSGHSATVDMEVNGLCDDRAGLERELGLRCSEIYHEVSGSCGSQYDASLALHDWLTRSVKYSDTGVRAHCALGPLLDGEGVCDGISDAYSLLMNAAGVRCTKVDGHIRSNPEVGHSWNISFIDGHAYHTDVTFDLDGMHRYLNQDDATMSLTHLFNRYVQCDSMEANYYRRNGTLFDTVEESDKYIRKSLGARRTQIEFMVLEGSSIEHYREILRKAKPGCGMTIATDEDGRGFQLTPVSGRGTLVVIVNRLSGRM